MRKRETYEITDQEPEININLPRGACARRNFSRRKRRDENFLPSAPLRQTSTIIERPLVIGTIVVKGRGRIQAEALTSVQLREKSANIREAAAREARLFGTEPARVYLRRRHKTTAPLHPGK